MWNKSKLTRLNTLMSKLVSNPAYWLILVLMIYFWQIFIGKVPVPGDLLAGRFFPWNKLSWPDFPLGVPYKEFILADVVRQTYPFRQLAMEQFKQGIFPVWNPYIMTGTPLLANLQSAVWYPLNIIYLFVPFLTGWIIQVISQVIIAYGGVYCFLKRQMSSFAAAVGGVLFTISGYFLVWIELNTIGHALAWLPWMWLGIDDLKNKWYRGMFLIVLATSSSLLSGHIQTTLMMMFAGLIYLGIKFNRRDKPIRTKTIIWLGLGLVLSLILSLPQIIPTFQLLQFSSRSGSNPQIFEQFLMPWDHLITTAAPNFYGNPALGNYFGQDFGEFLAFVSLSGLLLSVYGFLVEPKKEQQGLKKLGILLVGTGLLLATNNPVARVPLWLNLPVLSSSAPSRWLAIFSIGLSLLASLGLDSLVSNSKPDLAKLKKSLLGISAFLFGFIAFVILTRMVRPDPVSTAEIKVVLKHSVIPIFSLSIWFLIYLFSKFKSKANQPANLGLLGLVVSLTLVVEVGYLVKTYLPFAPSDQVFAQTPILEQLESYGAKSRFIGVGSAQMSSNTWMVDRVYGVEGYEALFPIWINELVAAGLNQGKLPEVLPRSDIAINIDDYTDPEQNKLLDLLGVEYLLYTIDFPESDWQPDETKFNPNLAELIWQEDKYQIYQRKNALLRWYFAGDYRVIADKTERLKYLFSEQHQPDKVVVLELEPDEQLALPIQSQDTSSIELIADTGQRLSLRVTSARPQFLVLSDTWYPGWHAYLNNQEVNIYRANHAHRAVFVPKGEFRIDFIFKYGLLTEQ